MGNNACCTDSKQRDPWRRVGDRAMKRGEFTICQYGNKPNEDYALFGAGPEMLAHGKTYQEMMDEADKLCAS